MQNVLKIGRDDVKQEQKSGDKLANFMGSKWFKALIINKYGLAHFSPTIAYKGNQKINGYEATKLVNFSVKLYSYHLLIL